MSAFLLGIGFRADMGTCARKLVLLKLIDACEDDGSRIFPAISTIARAAQCSTRQVQRELKAFLDIGLIRLVREGGKGPRSTNEYALDLDVLHLLGKGGWAAVSQEAVSGEAANRDANKGDTVSPLDEGEKGDTGDTIRVTPETPKGDKLSHPTPQDPSLDPSTAREREREDDPKKIETEGWALLKNWPGFEGMPKEPAMRIWRTLAPEERATARRRFLPWLTLLKAQRKSHVPAPSTYLTEKLWQAVPDPADAPPAPVLAAPFGKAWGARRMTVLLAGSGQLPPAKGFSAQLIEQGGEMGKREELSRQANHGFPEVNWMHQLAADGKGTTLRPDVEPGEAVLALMAAYRVGSDEYLAWKALHDERGWPWLPDPGRQEWVYFPDGGPAGLEAFQEAVSAANREAKTQAVRGKNDDASGCEAAE